MNVSEKEQSSRKPRLALRIIIVLLLLMAMTAALGYKKFIQIQTMMAQGSIQPPPIAVTVAVAKTADWNKRIKAIGTLFASQGVDISSEIQGIVTSINFDSGEEVKTGKLLIQLDSRSEIASLESAKAQYEADYSQYKRLIKLKDKEFVTINALDEQVALVGIAKSQIGIAEAALSKKSIGAPFAGKLGIRQIDLGEYIAPGISIVTLQSIDQLLLDFTLPESNFRDLEVGQSVSFKVRSYPDRKFSGTVTAWNPLLDENTRNVSIRAQVDNKERQLAPGMFAEIEVESSEKLAVLTVPETAIFYNIYGEAVYVLEKPEASDSDPDPGYILAARKVRVAYRVGGVAGVSEGLKAGDQVVTSGQLKLFPSLKVAIVDDVAEYQATTSTVQ
jgi:membrane fusion protein (multidrug efflux system)